MHFSSVEPVQRGFFCDDKSLKYPLKENETIPSLICFIIWMSITVFILLFKRRSFLKEFFVFILGLSICTLSTDMCKFSVVSLRPYFLLICKPKLESICYGEDSYYLDKNNNQTYAKEFYRKFVSEEETNNNHEAFIRCNPHMIEKLTELENKVIGCWCRDNCHGLIIIKLYGEFVEN